MSSTDPQVPLALPTSRGGHSGRRLALGIATAIVGSVFVMSCGDDDDPNEPSDDSIAPAEGSELAPGDIDVTNFVPAPGADD